MFNFSSSPSNPNVSQQSLINTVNNSPHIGTVQFIQFTNIAALGMGTNLSISLPTIQNGSPINFIITNVSFYGPSNYIVQGTNPNGGITIYVTNQGIGGVIDIFNRKFSIYPLGENSGVIFENDLNTTESSQCATDGAGLDHNHDGDFCHGDCGAAILDILILRTAEANQYLMNTWGVLGEWFLFVESNNINVALRNSQIPNKQVRIQYAPFTPDFSWSTNSNIITRINQDTASLVNSPKANYLMRQYRADIVVLLTNNNYADASGQIFGAVNNLNPFSPNKFAIVEAPFIDGSRFTFAHEVAHHFGCTHGYAPVPDCPNGYRMPNGRNTIMANGAANFTRIPHYSNPNVNFTGVATGVADTRDNAQQIRAAFCESANNNELRTFSASYSFNMPLCEGVESHFSSEVIQGQCPDPFQLNYIPECGLPPYSYEWRMSSSPDFTGSTILGTMSDLSMIISNCPVFYLRLTVTSSDGLESVYTDRLECHTGPNPCPRSSNKYEFQENILFPNPASKTTFMNLGEEKLIEIDCYDITGQKRNIIYEQKEKVVEIDVKILNSGIYFIYARTTKQSKCHKLVVE